MSPLTFKATICASLLLASCGSEDNGGNGGNGIDAGLLDDGGSPISDGGNTVSDGRIPTDATLTITECNDGIDNDSDGLVDWQYDLGCVSQIDTTEGGLANLAIEDGWSVFEASSDTRIVYVSSSSGDDSADGLAPDSDGQGQGPKQSLASGIALLRSGSADWLLLRRGDEWNEGFGSWLAAGRSQAEPTIIASYGSSVVRPIVHGGLYLGDVASAGQIDNLVVANIDFGNASIGAFQGNNILVEGCHFSGAKDSAITVEGLDAKSNWQIRRNSFDRPTQGGIFIAHVSGALIEGNVIYRPAANNANHAMYITRIGNSNIVTKDNLVFMGKTTGNGIMQRPGGVAEGNVVVDFGWSGNSIWRV